MTEKNDLGNDLSSNFSNQGLIFGDYETSAILNEIISCFLQFFFKIFCCCFYTAESYSGKLRNIAKNA